VFSSKPKILIVDDDAAILKTLGKIFQKKGYAVSTAEGGKQAIEKLGVSRFDVAVVDLALPDMEGDKLLPLIAKVSPKTVKIMLTGKIELQDNIEGADVFLKKPVMPDKLLMIIENRLSKRRNRRDSD